MEWGRAKSILIITFLLLNLLLGYQLWISNINLLNPFFGGNEMIQETRKLLEEKGIEIRGEIPTEKLNLNQITIDFDEKVQKDISFELISPVDVDEIISGEVNKTFLDEIEDFDQYQYDEVVSDENQQVFNQLYENLPLFDVQLKLYGSEGQLTHYDQQVAIVTPDITEEEQEVLSAPLVIHLLAEDYLKQGEVIEDIQLGYQGFESNPQALFPKWRIALGSGDIYYVHAFTGKVEVIQSI
ncbi:two-component system regulatory protein YycI [Chengkuizengella axinellae]|uniref:Two-component system regulatory protein YycI n=1 Tax=Chengkuizengella axinellae TaxID=3064388 RepID=A0ABT9J384_9BACL|nr:two-component system regulatory protein YycI [Chengkuizengella sp. 2205SS18-9]MDP5276050.1 two-component system regulatory protein YycI [Chengkuizengella sp. 2205SS18-9]